MSLAVSHESITNGVDDLKKEFGEALSRYTPKGFPDFEEKISALFTRINCFDQSEEVKKPFIERVEALKKYYDEVSSLKLYKSEKIEESRERISKVNLAKVQLIAIAFLVTCALAVFSLFGPFSGTLLAFISAVEYCHQDLKISQEEISLQERLDVAETIIERNYQKLKNKFNKTPDCDPNPQLGALENDKIF